MVPEPSPGQHPADLAPRQDMLERQVAELASELSALASKFSVLERQISSTQRPVLANQLSAHIPPPPPRSTPLITQPDLPAPPQLSRASLENRLGSQVFNRIGIVALLIGATWFLKLAVDNQWIGAAGRVLIGLVAGAGLVLWSERFRRSGFPAFSYSLKAIGSGILYLALWASFQLYHLLPAEVALVAMLLVTAWNAYMAWAQNAELLATYALAGGLATPLLLSTGGNHQIFLFTYLLAIDLACVTLSRLKSCPRLLAVALPATVAYFIGWFTSFYTPSQLGTTSLFVLLFFAAFTVAVFDHRGDKTLASGPPRQHHPIIPHILLPIANATFVSLALYSVLEDSGHHTILPWLMVALSAIYLGLLRLPQPPVTAAVHLSLAIVFLTIAIPLKANGSWITVGWLVEGVALLWVSTRIVPDPRTAPPSEPGPVFRVFRILASAALLLGFGGVLTELASQSFHAHSGFFNRAFGTAIAGAASFALSFAIARLARGSHLNGSPSFAQVAAGTLIAFNLNAVLAGVVQINSLGVYGAEGTDAALERALAVSAFLMFYGALLLAVGFWQRSAFIRWQALLLLIFTIAKTFLYDMRNLSQGYRVLSFLGLGALLMAVSFAYQKDWLALREPALVSHPHEGSPE